MYTYYTNLKRGDVLFFKPGGLEVRVLYIEDESLFLQTPGTPRKKIDKGRYQAIHVGVGLKSLGRKGSSAIRVRLEVKGVDYEIERHRDGEVKKLNYAET